MLEALEIWCLRKMQRISRIEKRINEEILKTIEEKRTLINTLMRR